MRSPGDLGQGKAPGWPWEIRKGRPRRLIRSGHTRETPGGHPGSGGRGVLRRLWSSESCCWKARPEEDLHREC